MAKLLLVGAAALLSFAIPTAANAQSSWHDNRHDRLDEVHGDVHEDLREEHADAHDQGLNRWEHSRLHGNLQNRHEDADYALELEHQRRDMRNRWRSRYQNYGYQGYGYQDYRYRGYGYRGYGYRGYNHPRYQRRSGFSIYLGN